MEELHLPKKHKCMDMVIPVYPQNLGQSICTTNVIF